MQGVEVIIAVVLIGAFFVMTSILFVLVYRRPLRAAWRDPVFRVPVMNFESDDWSPGPVSHAIALNRLRSVLAAHQDCHGQPAIMTLGVILGIPDVRAMKVLPSHYHSITLADRHFEDIHMAMLDGLRESVFSIQLHGLEHYWPETIMAAARDNMAVKEWIEHADERPTEELPSSLQSRWTDASDWPTQPHSDAAVERAVKQEVQVFQQVFGIKPAVVVPPTFVWTKTVEQAWQRQGVSVLVTPGTRFTGRDEFGEVRSDQSRFWNGEEGQSGIRYMVRNVYFEPERGHTSEQGLQRLEACVQLGRPCLFETHRSNFIGEPKVVENAFQQLNGLLDMALKRFPSLRFLSTEALADAIKNRDPELIDSCVSVRMRSFYLRVKSIPRIGKLGYISGFIVSLYLAVVLSELKTKFRIDEKTV